MRVQAAHATSRALNQHAIGSAASLQLEAARHLSFGALWLSRSADAQSLCASCEVQIGLGGTYHFWGATGGVVLPVSVTWSENRYELGFFRVTTQQMLHEREARYERVMAEPYWGVSLSRRWRLFESGPVQGFFGFDSLEKPSWTSSVLRAGTLLLNSGCAFACPATGSWVS